MDRRRRPGVRRGAAEDDQPGTDDPEQAVREPDGRRPGGGRRSDGRRAARGRRRRRDRRGAVVGARRSARPWLPRSRRRRTSGPPASDARGPSRSTATTGRPSRRASSPRTDSLPGGIGRPRRPDGSRDGLAAPRRAAAQQRVHGRLPVVEARHEPHRGGLRGHRRREARRGPAVGRATRRLPDRAGRAAADAGVAAGAGIAAARTPGPDRYAAPAVARARVRDTVGRAAQAARYLVRTRAWATAVAAAVGTAAGRRLAVRRAGDAAGRPATPFDARRQGRLRLTRHPSRERPVRAAARPLARSCWPVASDAGPRPPMRS